MGKKKARLTEIMKKGNGFNHNTHDINGSIELDMIALRAKKSKLESAWSDASNRYDQLKKCLKAYEKSVAVLTPLLNPYIEMIAEMSRYLREIDVNNQVAVPINTLQTIGNEAREVYRFTPYDVNGDKATVSWNFEFPRWRSIVIPKIEFEIEQQYRLFAVGNRRQPGPDNHPRRDPPGNGGGHPGNGGGPSPPPPAAPTHQMAHSSSSSSSTGLVGGRRGAEVRGVRRGGGGTSQRASAPPNGGSSSSAGVIAVGGVLSVSEEAERRQRAMMYDNVPRFLPLCFGSPPPLSGGEGGVGFVHRRSVASAAPRVVAPAQDEESPRDGFIEEEEGDDEEDEDDNSFIAPGSSVGWSSTSYRPSSSVIADAVLAEKRQKIDRIVKEVYERNQQMLEMDSEDDDDDE